MLEGLYSAAAGLAAQQQRLDAVSNDVANVSTAGYKAERLAFRDLAYAQDPSAPGTRVAAGAGAAVTYQGRTTAQGALQETGQSLDVAINGPGYIQVRRQDGTTALTRSGALRVDTNGRLGLATGELLQPPISVPSGVDPNTLEIASDGTVSGGGRRLGQITLRDVPAPGGLLDVGGNLHVATAASGAPRAAANARLQQGVLEGSNVDMSEAMVDLMDAQRSYTLASRVLQTQDQMMEIANGVKR